MRPTCEDYFIVFSQIFRSSERASPYHSVQGRAKIPCLGQSPVSSRARGVNVRVVLRTSSLAVMQRCAKRRLVISRCRRATSLVAQVSFLKERRFVTSIKYFSL